MAASASVYQGDDVARYYSSSGNLYAYDKEADGHGVYAEYRGPGSNHGQIWDGNGSKSGGSKATVGNIDKFRVCEDTWAGNFCSSWVYV